MNLAFFKAMKAAVQSGGESKRNFTYGPRVDHTPLVGAHFDRQLQHIADVVQRRRLHEYDARYVAAGGDACREFESGAGRT